jgi:hypothetical protein
MIADRPHALNRTLGQRYAGADADHVIVIHPGTASQGGVPEGFYAHHAVRGVEVWSVNPPAQRRISLQRCSDGAIAMGELAARSTGLPVFIMGTARGTTVAYRALHDSDVFWGAVLIGDFHRSEPPGARGQQSTNQPRGYPISDPRAPQARHGAAGAVAPGIAPMLCVVGGQGTNLPATVPNVIGDPSTDHAEVYRHPHRLSQLMRAPAELSEVVLDWCVRQLSNHLNPKWFDA